MFVKFPKDFLWGGAVSAEQTEGHGIGNKAKTVYDKQYLDSPSDFYQGVGPDKTCDFMRHYESDVTLWSNFKFNSHRTSFSWARIFPEGDYSKPNQEAVKWYHQFIDKMLENKITPIFTLFHFDMPLYAMEKGGWMSREVWQDFLKYAQFVLKEFGSKVKLWTTMNEPWVPMEVSYLGNIQYPKLDDDQAGLDAAYGIVMAHALVVNYFNKEIKRMYPDCEIGGIFNSVIVYPRDKNNPLDVKAARYLEMFQFTGLTDAMILGKWDPELKPWLEDMNLWPRNYDSNDLEILAQVKLDFVGLNFYQPLRAASPEMRVTNKHKPYNYFSYYKMPNRRENRFRGWEIYPEALYDTLKMMYERYGSDKKYMLTEYGIGVQREERFRNHDGQIDDQYRIVFMKEHLVQLARLMQDTDIKVMGAHVWATMDCWSWCNAFKNTYGLIEVNLDSQVRVPKSSAHFLKSVIENEGFDYDNQKTEDYIDFNKA